MHIRVLRNEIFVELILVAVCTTISLGVPVKCMLMAQLYVESAHLGTEPVAPPEFSCA